MTSDSEALAALAAQVADLRGRVGIGEAWQRRNKGLSGEVRRLAELVASLAGSGDGPAVTAPYWLDLGDADLAAALAALAEWVTDTLQANYPQYARVVKPCWQRHREAIWELSTLAAEWRAVYHRNRPDLDGALAWHDRWLPGSLHRLEQVMQPCNAAACRLDGS